MAKSKRGAGTPTIIPELYRGRMAGRPVRFFASPLTGPDFPWHAQTDFLAAFGYDDAEQRQIMADWARHQPQHVREIATADGSLRIASNLAATALFEFLEAVGHFPWDMFNEFIVARGRAVIARYEHLGDQDFCIALGEAAHRFDMPCGTA